MLQRSVFHHGNLYLFILSQILIHKKCNLCNAILNKINFCLIDEAMNLFDCITLKLALLICMCLLISISDYHITLFRIPCGQVITVSGNCPSEITTACNMFYILIIIIIFKNWYCMAGRGWMNNISLKTPTSKCQPTDGRRRSKRKQ